jgi:hypothetical protein
MLPATAAFVFFMYVTDQVMAQMHAEQQRQRAGVAFDRAERIVTDQRVPDWQGRLKEIEATFRVAHEIIPVDKALSDFFMSSSEKERLQNGEIAFRDRPGGGTVYLRRIKDTDRALRIEWVGAYEYLALYYSIIVLLVTTALALILWRLTRPLWRDLEGLKAATARVGEGISACRRRSLRARCCSRSPPRSTPWRGVCRRCCSRTATSSKVWPTSCARRSRSSSSTSSSRAPHPKPMSARSASRR